MTIDIINYVARTGNMTSSIHTIGTICVTPKSTKMHKKWPKIMVFSNTFNIIYRIETLVSLKLFGSHTHFEVKPRPFRSFLRETISPTSPIDLFLNEFSAKVSSSFLYRQRGGLHLAYQSIFLSSATCRCSPKS